jgi:hypothetical protein
MTITHAQTDYAALLHIETGIVEVRRVNTTAWIRLPVGAETPIGVGDTIRTGFFGRAWITLLDGAMVYLLPTTEWGLSAFGADADGFIGVTITQNGRVIYELTQPELFTTFKITSPHLTLTYPANLFAVQTTETATSVVVADGEARVRADDEAQSPYTFMGENVGVRGDANGVSAPIRLDVPMTFSQLDGRLDGCIGVIQTGNQRDLNVRVGPTENYDVIGSIPNGSTVALMGVSPNGERYRVAYKSNFGWILAQEVRNTCDNLPVYGYNTLERQYGVIAPTEIELRLLAPFFGMPTDDDWFYYGCDEDC